MMPPGERPHFGLTGGIVIVKLEKLAAASGAAIVTAMRRASTIVAAQVGRLWQVRDCLTNGASSSVAVTNLRGTAQEALDELMNNADVRNGGQQNAFRALAQAVAQELRVERVAFRVLGTDKTSLVYDEVYLAATHEFVELPYSKDPDFVRQLTQRFSQSVIAVDDTSVDSELSVFYADIAPDKRFASAMLAQVIAHGHCVGVLTCSNVKSTVQWSVEQKFFASSVCKLAALVIERHAREKLEVAAAHIAKMLQLQHSILVDIGGHEAFCRGSLKDALSLLCEKTLNQPLISRACVYRCDPCGTQLRPLALVDRREDAFDHVAALDAVSFIASGQMSDMTEPNIISDLQSDPSITEYRRSYSKEHNLRGAIDMPIKKDGMIVGVLCLRTSGDAPPWSQEDVMFASSLATCAAWVFERADRLLAETNVANAAQRLSLQQEILGSLISDTVFRDASIESALAHLTERACLHPVIDRASIYALDADAQMLSPFGIYDRREKRHRDGPQVPVTFFSKDGKLQDMSNLSVIFDLSTDPTISEERRAYSIKNGLRGAVDRPIMINGKVIGVLCLRSCSEPREWTEDEILFTTSLATLAALCLERHERQKVEAELRVANATAIAATKAKSSFLANMSHEIRTPMNGVLGMADLLAETELTTRQSRLVRTIGTSARTLLTIINDILDLSRIEEGKLTLDFHSFDLSTCAEDAVALLAEAAQHKGVELSLFVDQSANVMATGDSVRLRQVLLNLIGNAVKFTSKGEVSVRVRVAEMDAGLPRMTIEVRDTGMGIDPKVLPQLFEPFTQADATINRRFGGTGLGLSISRQLIAMMGGTMDMTSELNVGTTVVVHVPIEVKPLSTGYTKPSAELLAGKRILVVDDRATNREIVCAYLDGCGARAEPAQNAAEAMDLMKNAATEGTPFALAFVDVIMPGIDGLQLCSLIKASASLHATQLVLLSSLSWSRDLGDLNQAGVERILHKPIRRQELLQVATGLLALATADREFMEAPLVPQAAIAADRFVNLRVLVAEDNLVNQEIASDYLAGLGCIVTMVDNGLDAVAITGREHFDVVLMDCQMPEMDGMSATQNIRAREHDQNSRAIPIIAATANAFEEDRRRCLAAGMNDYICKPFSKAQLADALQRWVPAALALNARPESTLTPASKSAPTEAVAQPKVAPSAAASSLKVERPALYARLLSIYLQQAPAITVGLKHSLSSQDFNDLKFAAHSLKSSSANVEAHVIADLSKELEVAAKVMDVAACASLVAQIDRQMAAFGAEAAGSPALAQVG
jgi:signal transduction histidine kinase/DNA-binding response OmpR family regulator/HPt (histidine-containing phosphotransfer) domain-containing protein